MFDIIRPGTNIDFVGKRKLWLGMSIVAILGSFLLLSTRGLNFGIDFAGGIELHVKVPADVQTAEIRENLESAGIEASRVQQIGESASGEYLIKTKSSSGLAKKMEEVLKEKYQDRFEVLRSDNVGPAAGSLLRKKGILAVLYALLAILVYVAIRFDTRYAPGAVLALFHDSMIVIGIFCLTQKQFDLTILAAILALIGYSNNDTIIVYDRVRESSLLHPDWPIEKIVNSAVNETLGRSIMTSLTTFLVAAALFFFGGPVIHDFAFTFMVGILVGAYSSIFIASSVIIYLTHWKEKKRSLSQSNSKKRVYTVRPDPGK